MAATQNNKNRGSIMIIDDDADILHTTRMVLKKHFGTIITERNPGMIYTRLAENDFDVILLDMNFKAGSTTGKEGIQWLQEIKKASPDTQVVMITAYGDINLAVKAMKDGATDFVVKPWENKKLLATMLSACQLSQSKKEIHKYKNRESTLMGDMDKAYTRMIGDSPAMQEPLEIIKKVSQTEANVLILGENGTGKELVAREIHRQSNRADQIFIGVDLGALPETLFESELLGYSKGAFTDAHQDKAGRFEVAGGGTLFLDEIGNLSMPLQAKLLTALEKRNIYRIGSNKPIRLNIRLICATNQPLYDMVKQRKFREDLLYRINTVEIMLPPLRERTGDIPQLISHFLHIYSKRYNKTKIKISQSAFQKLAAYNWPGNIRELQHLIERAVIMTGNNLLEPNDFLLTAETAANLEPDTLNMAAIEKDVIKKAITKHSGNLSLAARELGLGRTTLYRKIEKYGI